MLERSQYEETAFPHSFRGASTTMGNCTINTSGMTLLDYFAAKALQQPLTYRPANLWEWLRWAFGYSYKCSTRSKMDTAINAYKMAKAMMEERKYHLPEDYGKNGVFLKEAQHADDSWPSTPLTKEER